MFLYGNVEEEKYMKQPKGYIQEGQENKVYLLKKSLYECKQSPIQWYKPFDSFMINAIYNRCEYDNYVYFKQNDDTTYLLLYMDNMMIAARNKVHI